MEKNSPQVRGMFADFAKKMDRIATSKKSYSSRSFRTRGERIGRYKDYTVETIREILNTGKVEDLE